MSRTRPAIMIAVTIHPTMGSRAVRSMTVTQRNAATIARTPIVHMPAQCSTGRGLFT